MKTNAKAVLIALAVVIVGADVLVGYVAIASFLVAHGCTTKGTPTAWAAGVLAVLMVIGELLIGVILSALVHYINDILEDK